MPAESAGNYVPQRRENVRRRMFFDVGTDPVKHKVIALT